MDAHLSQIVDDRWSGRDDHGTIHPVMICPLLSAHERLLARRYLFPGVGGRLMLLVAAIGVAGVMIGVASLILVVSVMNGAQARLAGQVASVDGHLAVTRIGHTLPDWRRLTRQVAAIDGVARAVPTLRQSGLVTFAGRTAPADFQGLRLSDMRRLPAFGRPDAFVTGALPTHPGDVAVGIGVADRLGIGTGDGIAVTTVRIDADGQLAIASTPLIVAGIYRTGAAAYDDQRVIASLVDVQRVFGRGDIASRIDIAARDDDVATRLAPMLHTRLTAPIIIHDWRELNATLFQAMAQEHVAMAAIVAMVTGIALANILSTMGMLVRFKAREIAILRTMGMSAGSVARVFLMVGAVIGVAGEIAGLALGLGLKASKDMIADAVWHQTGPSPELAILRDLPLTLPATELAVIVAGVLAGVLLASLFPAIRAARLDPARILRHG